MLDKNYILGGSIILSTVVLLVFMLKILIDSYNDSDKGGRV